MDEQVLAAIARWPNVPDVYGWLSLSRRGIWHLHPEGRWDAEVSGEPITNSQITAFIGRNYAADAAGRWYFQNGPQRVYVRLDAAPWILHTDQDADGTLHLVTHTKETYGPVTHWWLDTAGHLYAQADQGAGLVDGRDLPHLLERLRNADGSLLNALEQGFSPAVPEARRIFLSLEGSPEAPLNPLPDGQESDCLEFVTKPLPDAKISA